MVVSLIQTAIIIYKTKYSYPAHNKLNLFKKYLSPTHCTDVNTQDNFVKNFEEGVYPQVSHHSPSGSSKWQACGQLKKS